MGPGSLSIGDRAWSSRVRVMACRKVECHLGICYQNSSTKKRRTYSFLNYLPGHILPVLCIRITCCNLCCLFFRAAPRVFDVSEFIVWMESFTGSVSTCLETKSKPYQAPRQSLAYHRGGSSTFRSFRGHR